MTTIVIIMGQIPTRGWGWGGGGGLDRRGERKSLGIGGGRMERTGVGGDTSMII